LPETGSDAGLNQILNTMALLLKTKIAAYCVELTYFWFALAEDTTPITDICIKTGIFNAKGNGPECDIELGSHQFYMNAKKSDLMRFIKLMNRAVSKEINKWLFMDGCVPKG
jgi:hypothetical protein